MEITEIDNFYYQFNFDRLYYGCIFKVYRKFYWHYGIYCGYGEVIHYVPNPNNTNKGVVAKTSLNDFFKSGVGRLNTRYYEPMLHPREVFRRAYSFLGRENYNLVLENFEHVAYYCANGEYRSYQVEQAFRFIVATVITVANIYSTYKDNKDK